MVAVVAYNGHRKGRCGKRLALWVKETQMRNRHRPGWRFLPFIRIVTVYPRICSVIVTGICLTPFRELWPNRLPSVQRRIHLISRAAFCQFLPPVGAAFYLPFGVS